MSHLNYGKKNFFIELNSIGNFYKYYSLSKSAIFFLDTIEIKKILLKQ